MKLKISLSSRHLDAITRTIRERESRGEISHTEAEYQIRKATVELRSISTGFETGKLSARKRDYLIKKVLLKYGVCEDTAIEKDFVSCHKVQLDIRSTPHDILALPQSISPYPNTDRKKVFGMDAYLTPEQLEFQHTFFTALENFKFQEVPKETRFWMLRTQRGYFYQEFVFNKFVALGWNIIDRTTPFSKENIERLKSALTTNYVGVGRPMTAIHKCDAFINTVNAGDYILIPSEGSRYITIALAGEYYEDQNCTYELENEVIAKIRDGDVTANELKCPYKKRRKITPLITLPSHKLHYRLLRALSNYHGISNLDEYAHYILSAVYRSYSFGDTSVITLWSAQTDPISPRALSGLLYHSTTYLCNFVDEKNLSTKVNLNSEGPIQFFIQGLQNDFPALVNTFLIVAGIGTVVTHCEKVPDLIKGLLSIPADLYEKYLSAKHKKDELAHQDQMAQLDQEAKQLEIMDKKIALIEKIKASGCNPEALEGNLIDIAKCAIEMKVAPALEEAPNFVPEIDIPDHTPDIAIETANGQADTQ